ncbi:putative L,D-transpeptidase ErfK/SrfK precursor [Shimia sp. SK013]|uniref:L,D-transpeptidase n=1 Tax=Shimia sp. SK013 TaxID=1389006 RepID=UPI0006CD1247|nr:L,D-transpeptidase [Shimia sp. SK013]KPA22153.1 putative L,D-transpeptidase ErfK/SrfK precursor [Shimia sp. SK013]
MPFNKLPRRAFLAALPALCLTARIGSAQETTPQPAPALRNISSFSKQDWRTHFDDLGVATIVADTTSRALHFWSGDGADYRVFPTSVPMSEDLTKRGYTEIIRKRVGPDWTPTPSMVERNPDLKYMPPGPDNPLGTHAMYLGWPAYLIHGTHDTRKIGRRSSDGCIGLYNPSIEDLFAVCPVGTQVRII